MKQRLLILLSPKVWEGISCICMCEILTELLEAMRFKLEVEENWLKKESDYKDVLKLGHVNFILLISLN